MKQLLILAIMTMTLVMALSVHADADGSSTQQDSGSGWPVELLVQTVSDTLMEGTTKTYTIGYSEYHVTLASVSDIEGMMLARFTVAQVTPALRANDAQQLSEGIVRLKVNDVFMGPRGGVASFTLSYDSDGTRDDVVTCASIDCSPPSKTEPITIADTLMEGRDKMYTLGCCKYTVALASVVDVGGAMAAEFTVTQTTNALRATEGQVLAEGPAWLGVTDVFTGPRGGVARFTLSTDAPAVTDNPTLIDELVVDDSDGRKPSSDTISDTLMEGTTKTYAVGCCEYAVTLTSVDGDVPAARFTVTQVTPALRANAAHILSEASLGLLVNDVFMGPRGGVARFTLSTSLPDNRGGCGSMECSTSPKNPTLADDLVVEESDGRIPAVTATAAPQAGTAATAQPQVAIPPAESGGATSQERSFATRFAAWWGDVW